MQKRMQLAITAAVLIAAVFLIGNAVTGFVAYQKELEQLEQAQQQLSAVEANLTQCNTDLSAKDSSLGKCTSDYSTLNTDYTSLQGVLKSCESQKQEVQDSLAECDSEKADIEERLAGERQNYTALVESSVIAICCRPGIETSNYAVVNNSITCAGNLTVNCR